MKPVRTLKLLGKVWRLKWASRLGSQEEPKYGDCDDPTEPNRTIRISRECVGKRLLIILIHEMLHACFWQVDEDVVWQAAEDIGNVLWRLGFRRVINDKYDDRSKDV